MGLIYMAKKVKKKSNESTSLYTSFSKADLQKHELPKDNIVFSGKGEISKFNIQEKSRMRSVAAAGNVDLQAGFNRHDRNLHRPEDVLPTGHSDIIATCQAIYKKVGMIRNIIDLMADFASEGLELKHPIKKQEKFYKAWAKKVDLSGRAHDWLKLFLRDGNVIVRRKNAQITIPVIKQMTKADIVGLMSLEETSVEEKPEKLKKEVKKVKKGEIPWRYVFISPVVVEKIGGEVGRFYGGDRLAMRISPDLRNSITKPKTNAESDFVKRLPSEIVKKIKNKRINSTLLALDPERTYVDYYKKDDWEDWGTPFLFGVLEDILLKEKMKLADVAALDGVINVTRIWKLGDHTEKILPTAAAVNKLIDLLQYNVSGGIKDIVWDSMIDMKVEYPPIDKILGDEKYKAVNRDIMKGLGVPEALVGGVDLATRNAETAFVQLKTLIERLEYARERCVRWLTSELSIVSDAMGFKRIPSISFGTMSLRDEAAEKQLMIQLADRGFVSIQAIHEIFGTDFVSEVQRIREEQGIRDKDSKILEKSNPYFRPISQMELQHKFRIELEKLKQLQMGNQDELSKRGGDNPNGDQPRDSGNNNPGRPPNTVDTNPRDERTEKTLSVYKVKGEEHLLNINKIIDPLYLKSKGVKGIRALNKGQTQELERMKFLILATLQLNDTVTQDLIHQRTTAKFNKIMEIFGNALDQAFLRHAEILGRPAKLNERRSLAASIWATVLSSN
jgi:hypothetical protein